MQEELDTNDVVLQQRQINELTSGRNKLTANGKPENRQRCYVSAVSVVFFLLLALAGLCLWMLRLLGVLENPFAL